MNSFAGKNICITGGSSGIGLATACRFFAQGSHITILGRNQERLEQAYGKIEKYRVNSGQRLNTLVLDVADASAVARELGYHIKERGIPDIFVNSAGRARPGYFEDISHEQFDETMKINLYGIWNTLKVIVPHMKKRRKGHIVNVSSVAGFIGVFGYTDYSASKFAILGLSEALACELSPHRIRVSVLFPPDTDTPGFEEENRSKPPETKAISGSAGLVSADKVAQALLQGIRRRNFFILPGGNVKLTIWLKRFLPWLVKLVMNNTVRKVQSGMKTAFGRTMSR